MIKAKELGVLQGQINEIEARSELLDQRIRGKDKLSEGDVSMLICLEKDMLTVLKRVLDIESEFSST